MKWYNTDVCRISYISRVVGDYIIIYTVCMCKISIIYVDRK